MSKYTEPDHWSQKAQKEGYPARSVYKLKEMDEKFRLLKNTRTGSSTFKILDLGAAPGSWSLYLMRSLSSQGSQSSQRERGGRRGDLLLVAVDLAPLSREYDQGLFDRAEFDFIQGDFTQGDVREAILSKGPYNLIVSDAAPATSGNRSLDTLRSLALGETALEYAETALSPGGNLVIKVFQGGETGNLLKAIRCLFDSGKSYKPAACRSDSFETYYLGLGKKSGVRFQGDIVNSGH